MAYFDIVREAWEAGDKYRAIQLVDSILPAGSYNLHLTVAEGGETHIVLLCKQTSAEIEMTQPNPTLATRLGIYAMRDELDVLAFESGPGVKTEAGV